MVANTLGKPLSLGYLSAGNHPIPGNAILPKQNYAIGSFGNRILPSNTRSYNSVRKLSSIDPPDHTGSDTGYPQKNIRLLANPETVTLPLEIKLHGSYLVTAYLKRGADGAVYEGFAIKDGVLDETKPLVFKCYNGGEKSQRPMHAKESFDNEIAILLKLSRLEDFDREGLVSVMPKISGQNLFDMISKYFEDEESNSLTIAHLINKYLQLPVNFTETWGLVHLDVRPQNVIVDTAGDMHLIDFAYTALLSTNETIARDQRLLDGFIARRSIGLNDKEEADRLHELLSSLNQKSR